MHVSNGQSNKSVNCSNKGGIHLASNKKTVPFYGTEEQKEELLGVIEELRNEKGCLMPIMQRAQDIYGYLPQEVQTIISDELGVPLEKIYGVATFYSQFNLNPKGKYQISVCLGTACYVKGSGDIYNKLMEILDIAGGECTPDGKFSLDACRCVGACGLAPVLMVNGEVYGRLTVDDVYSVLEKYN
jgi:NADP-reducing hydrogenase subunit HndA